MGPELSFHVAASRNGRNLLRKSRRTRRGLNASAFSDRDEGTAMTRLNSRNPCNSQGTVFLSVFGLLLILFFLRLILFLLLFLFLAFGLVLFAAFVSHVDLLGHV